MTRSSEWDDEWRKLREERAAVRKRWICAVQELDERSRDPLGVKRLLRDHPVVAAGAGAGIAALLVKMLLGRHDKTKPAHDESAAGNGAEEAGGSPFMRAVRRAAMGIAVPWITRTVAAKVAQHFHGDDAESK